MKISEFYERINGDYKDVMERLLNREELVHRFLKKYVSDPAFSRLEEAVATGDVEEIFRASHTLKGVVSNLGLKPIADTTHVLVEITRAGKSEGITESFAAISKAYHDTIALIEAVD